MKKFLSLLALLWLAACPAFAQIVVDPIQQPYGDIYVYGVITPGDCVSWYGPYYIQDTGAACGSGGSGGSWLPLVTGADPAVFITDGAGNLITVGYNP